MSKESLHARDNRSPICCRLVFGFSNISTSLIHIPKDYEGKLNFATDCWTSPNHRAFTAITVHFETNDEPMCILLDVVELAESHSGLALAGEFARILEEFSIDHKVSLIYTHKIATHSLVDPERHV